ncbi:hypothetical protein JXQ70_09340 [bacterium]|nr:hypothetical protein [bacterium]
MRLAARLNETVIKPIKGKMRRFYYCNFRREYVVQQVLLRHGTCKQCGKCCYLLFKCPFLRQAEGKTYCTIYHGKRPKQCIAFPIDEQDLADVGWTCSHSFPTSPQS